MARSAALTPTEKESRRTIRTFALASFLNDFGSDIIYPIWPLFLTTVLKANMAAVGFLDGLGEALVSLSQAASGYVSDRIKKRKVFIWIGYLCGSLSRLGYAAASAWPQVIPFRILDRAGKIRSAPRDAVIADISVDANRGRHFGLLRAMDNLGAIFGILFCLLFINILGYRLLFALAAIPSLVGALLIVAMIKERPAAGIKVFKGLSFKDIGKDLRLYLALSATFALGAFSYSFLLVYAKQASFKFSLPGIKAAGAATIPLLYLVFTVVAALLSMPFGKLSDRVGRKKVLLLSYLFWALACAGVISGRSDALLFLVFVLYGLHKAALEPVQKTLVCELAPTPFRASCLGAFQMVVGLCAFPASLIAGLLWDRVGLLAPFYLALGLTAVSAFLLVFVREKWPMSTAVRS